VQGDTQAFIIRIWHEVLDDRGKIIAWRGSIEQVGSNRRLYFQHWDEMIRFLQEQTGIDLKGRRPRWKSWLARITGEAT
jgi:hypothetical protein